MDKNRKFVILLGDGMADCPIESLGNKTPLEAASIPNIDFLTQNGILGLARTVPDGMAPGSDTANLSIFGYDPATYYSGRAPLEAINMGIDLGPDDVAFRCNLVSIQDQIMDDFTADHIDTEFTKIVIEEIAQNIRKNNIEFYPGVSYRNIMVWRNYPHEEIAESTPPHDIQGQNIISFLPKGDGAERLKDIMTNSSDIIQNSKIINKAFSEYQGYPTSAWLWGAGRKPSIKSLKDRFGLYGHTISAVDLIHGIGKAAGLTPIHVEGVTGYIDTNYIGKARGLLKGLKDCNFIFLHVESPDESGHEGDVDKKIKSIEDFDEKVVGPVLEGIKAYDDYTILVMPDHPTPIKIRTHTSDPVPFCIYRNRDWEDIESNYKKAETYSEASAKETGLYVEEGHRLIEFMIDGKI